MLKRIARDDHGDACARPTCVFRFGGEEFVVICDGLAGEPALALGERIRREIAADATTARLARHGQRRRSPPARDDAADYDALFAVADQRLYQAKAAGRNCVIGERVLAVENPARLREAV